MLAHIIGGWSEGYRHEIKLRQGLTAAGIDITSSSRSADIIITHSAGFYFLPKEPGRRLTVIIDPPYWPGKNMATRILQHMILQAPAQIRQWGLSYWLKHRFWNTAYIIISPLKHFRIWLSLRTTLSDYTPHQARVLLI